jgi:transposase InsO family protein
LSAPAVVGAAAPAPAAMPEQCRSALLDLSKSMVWWLASSAPYCETGDGVAVAATGLEGLLDVAVTSGSEDRSPLDSPGASRSHPTHGHRKSPVGSKADPSRADKVGLQGTGKNVAKHMRLRSSGGPSPGWRRFLKHHASNTWACDFFCVQTILFETLYVFFVIRYANREILHVGVTRYPTAERAAQQIVECCAWDRWPPRFLIHDRDNRYGMTFDNRLRRLGIKQIRTPYRSPRANAVAERWVKSARSECFDHLFIFSEAGLRRDLSTYVSYFNHWRPHRSIGQRTPRDPEGTRSPSQRKYGKIIADPILGGLHHVYKLAA